MSSDNIKNTDMEPSENLNKKKSGSRKYIIYAILALIVIVGGYFAYHGVHFYLTHAETEDAQINGYISPVLPRVSGYVTDVHVEDNDQVARGQLLVDVDSTEFVLKVHMAQTALENANANLDVAKADLQTALVRKNKANLDYNRARNLYKGGATTQARFDDAKSAFEAASAQYEAASQRIKQIRSEIKQRQDALDYARLELSYTHIKSPGNGIISKKDVEVGQLVQAGQPLMAVTDIRDVWVTANYKETELSNLHVGQKVKIYIDAYPDTTFMGRIASIAGGTGAKFALLPPDNATGNFVKVVQRVPVKIVFLKDYGKTYPMRLGLNVTTSIDITQHVPGSQVTMSQPADK